MCRHRVKCGPLDLKDFISQKHMHPQSTTKPHAQTQNAVSDARTLGWSLKGRAAVPPLPFFLSCFPPALSLTPLPCNKVTCGFVCTSWFLSYSEERTTLVPKTQPGVKSQPAQARRCLGLRLHPWVTNRTEDLFYNDLRVPSTWACFYEQHRLLLLSVPFWPA